MSKTWFCYNCDENIGDAKKCPYCGYSRNGEEDKYAPTAQSYIMAKKALYGDTCKSRQNKKPIFTDEERLDLGLHPKDKGYKMSLISRILGKR